MVLLYCAKPRIEDGGWKMAILYPRFSILDLPLSILHPRPSIRHPRFNSAPQSHHGSNRT
jgi:hypothetical protein